MKYKFTTNATLPMQDGLSCPKGTIIEVASVNKHWNEATVIRTGIITKHNSFAFLFFPRVNKGLSILIPERFFGKKGCLMVI